MRPFMRAFRLADPAIKLDMTSGSIISLSIRINNSPGYEISMIESWLRCSVRKLKPGKIYK